MPVVLRMLDDDIISGAADALLFERARMLVIGDDRDHPKASRGRLARLDGAPATRTSSLGTKAILENDRVTFRGLITIAVVPIGDALASR